MVKSKNHIRGGYFMQTIPQIDLRVLPENAQQEVYDFYLFVKQRVSEKEFIANIDEAALLSEKSLAEDWDKKEEDEAWKEFQ